MKQDSHSQTQAVSSYASLMSRIAVLKTIKISQEEELRCSFKEFVGTLSPLSLVKDSLHKLAADGEVRTDLVKVALNSGANLIIGKVLGKRKSLGGFISSILLENVSASFIYKKSPEIISFLNRLMNG